jgi:diacylglycerol kinase (ATP)
VKVALIYNSSAGGSWTPAELRKEIEAAGHEIVAMFEPDDDPLKRVPSDAEVVAVAGGDGTVGRLAMKLAGGHLPLAILPGGTANNIATSLGLTGTVAELAAGWRLDRRLRLDLGVVGGPFPARRFVESIGFGLVTRGIHLMDSEDHEESDPKAMLHKALRRFLEVLRHLPVRQCRTVLDGEVREEELLVAQVLNIPAVGPGLLLGDDVDPSDGLFDLVTAGEAERPLIERYLHDRIEGRHATLRLPTRRVRRVELTGWPFVHIDDEIDTDVGDEPVVVEPAPEVVEILAGPSVRA